jgi:glycosyltransferase involved in cell wall biosynthesis
LKLKVIHLPYTYYPNPVGGTEVFVASLARNLTELGVECMIAAPSLTQEGQDYQYEGLKVCLFPVGESSRMLNELYGEGDPQSASRFAKILDREKPDVVHMHAFTRSISVLLAREAKRRGINLVFTYHTPTVSCQRGTMLRYGREVCDGILDRRTCTRCTLEGLGVNGTGGRMLSAVPRSLGHVLAAANLEGGIWTALRMTDLIQIRHDAFRQLMQESDVVITHSRWVKELLLRNGVPAQKVTLSSYGLPHQVNGSSFNPPIDPRPFRIAFLGRADRAKGPDILIRALRAHTDLEVKLDLYGIVQGEANKRYFEELKLLAAGDSRISFLSTLQPEQVVDVLRGYHVLAVPSRCLETGPLVAFEAFAAGTPVMGSRLGGIAELVEDGRNGLLVEPDSAEAWGIAIQRFLNEPNLRGQLAAGIGATRSMEEVAKDMISVYKKSFSASTALKTP